MQIAEFMSIFTAVPDKFSQTGDGVDFILFRDWTDDDKIQSMVICLSGFGADILRNHLIWLCDCTFKSTPAPCRGCRHPMCVCICCILPENLD